MAVYKHVALPKTLDDYFAAREKTLALLEHAHRAIADAEQVLAQFGAFGGLPYDAKPRESLEGITRQIDQRLWRLAFDKTGLMHFMDAQAKADFERELDGKTPAFTEDTVRATLVQHAHDAEAMFARGIVNVFRRLSGRYRSNDAFKVAPKVVIEYVVGPRFAGRGLEVRTWYANGVGTLNDIDRVFHVLDGERHDPRRLEMALNAAFHSGETNLYEDRYFRIRGFKNGNVHLWFLRADLLERVNRIISDYHQGNAVPDARRAA